jgi:NAD(P)-dependent dehydrogenase (short-subunit alcohol dehydrogenase family)
MKTTIGKKTVLITGSSTGIGKATADYFLSKGWNVAATMRNPEKANGFAQADNLRLYALDVTDSNSIRKAIDLVFQDFGNIDVVVNNAGYGAVGIFEKASKEEIQKQFDTNVFGVMNVIREILPHFREMKGGTIVNVTSMGGRLTFPLYSLYHGTKWALEGFGESLQFELRRFNIKVKNVEPGAIKTDFYSRSMNVFSNPEVKGYDDFEKVVFNNTQKTEQSAPGPLVVAKKIFKAASSNSFKLRYPVGGGGPMLLFIRRILPLSWYFALVRMVTEKGLKKV